MECPFTVFPPKQKWIGRPVDRQFQLTATPVGAEGPVPPRMATYRQKAWLPWWMSIVAPLVVALAVVIVMLLPKQTTVPNLKGQPSAFAAQKLLNKIGLKLGKTTQQGRPQAEARRGHRPEPRRGIQGQEGDDGRRGRRHWHRHGDRPRDRGNAARRGRTEAHRRSSRARRRAAPAAQSQRQGHRPAAPRWHGSGAGVLRECLSGRPRLQQVKGWQPPSWALAARPPRRSSPPAS